MKTKIKGTATEYWTDEGDFLLKVVGYNGKYRITEALDQSAHLPLIAIYLESYAKQLLEAVEAAKLVINMNERG